MVTRQYNTHHKPWKEQNILGHKIEKYKREEKKQRRFCLSTCYGVFVSYFNFIFMSLLRSFRKKILWIKDTNWYIKRRHILSSFRFFTFFLIFENSVRNNNDKCRQNAHSVYGTFYIVITKQNTWWDSQRIIAIAKTLHKKRTKGMGDVRWGWYNVRIWPIK